ncbi:hypothetical protein Sjap_011845 [Stephania japonica]|uniref:Stress-response A/B barrel domain-containing protein n=1 Tax=Stephania japonica TaxID=461633 RepID=A0AAP0JE68_9MAGN
MVSSLAGLTALPQVQHLSVGPILKTHSPFTHLLHSRYSSKHDLASYSSHPDHLSAVRSSVLPICLDILAVDWLSPHRPPSPIPPGSAIRLTLMKAKEDGAVGEVLGLIGGFEGRIAAGGLLELSFGQNFSPARAQGFGIASIAVFKGLGDLEALDSGVLEDENVKVRGFLESVIDVDFVVPGGLPSDPSASASL